METEENGLSERHPLTVRTDRVNQPIPSETDQMTYNNLSRQYSDTSIARRSPTETLNEFARIKFDELPRSPMYQEGHGVEAMGLFIDENGQPIAIIPCPDEILCYQFIGQHSSISPEYAIEKLIGVDRGNQQHMENCADLILHLIGQGYRPAIVKTDAIESFIDWDRFIGEAMELWEVSTPDFD